MKYKIEDLVRRDAEQTERVRRARVVDRLVILGSLLVIIGIIAAGVYL